MGDVRLSEQGIGDREYREGNDEQADSAVGQQRAGKHHGEDRASAAEPVGKAAGDGARRTGHKGLGEAGEQRTTGKGDGRQGHRGRREQQAEPAKGQPDAQSHGEENTEESDPNHRSTLLPRS